jgi:hypothetical protein
MERQPLSRLLIKKAAQDALMQGMRRAISNLPSSTMEDLELRCIAELQFRRAENLFGYEPNSWLATI